jgi:L-aspartate oxidase
MWRDVSLRRDAKRLTEATETLRSLAASGPMDPETANMLLAAQLIATAALAREESRGGHFREDFPHRDAALDGVHSLLHVAMVVAPQEAREVAAHV